MRRAPAPRALRPGHGFTLLTVLLVVVLIAAIVAGVLSALRSQSISAIRGREESAARAIAETCADRMFAYSTSYIKEVASGEAQPPADFDRLLDPDGIVNNADDFMPPGGSANIASVPPGSTSLAHRYRVLRIDGGACLVRFDDNSDDWHPGLGDRSTGNNGVIEGPAVGDEVLTRDRDRSIWVSVIGVFPAFDTTSDAELWTRAHARVSVRRFLETAGGPAIWAGGDVNLALGGTAVCGLGGIVSESIAYGSSNVCACGQQKHDDITDAIPNECNYTADAGDACDDRTRACEPNLREELPQPAPQGTELPVATSFKVLTQAMVADETCAIWSRDRDAPEPAPKNAGEVAYKDSTMPVGTEAMAFIWVSDADRAGALPQLTTALGITNACQTLLGAPLGTCPSTPTGLGVETCGASPPLKMPPPCRYSMKTSGGKPDGLQLDECRTIPATGATPAITESRCWVPIAVVDGQKTLLAPSSQGLVSGIASNLVAALPPLALLAGGTVDALAAGLTEDIVGVGEQTVIIGGIERLALQKYEASLVVNVAGVTTNIGSILIVGPLVSALVTSLTGPLLAGEATAPKLCGGGCSGSGDCSGQPLLFVNGSRLSSDAGFESQRSSPPGVTLVVENGNDTLLLPTPTKPTGGVPGDSPLQLAIRAQGNVDWTGKAVACCPTCRCPGAPAKAAIVSGAGVVLRAAMPAVAAVLPKRRATNAAPGPPGTDCDSQAGAVFLPEQGGGDGVRSLLHADGACRINGASTLIGRISCANVTVTSITSGSDDRKNGGCFVGGIDGRATCGIDTPCPASAPPAAFNTCTTGTPIAGCDDVGLCIEGALGIVGNVRSATDVCIRKNTTIYGQIIGLEDVAITRDVVVNHDNAGSIGAVTQAQAWIEAYP